MFNILALADMTVFKNSLHCDPLSVCVLQFSLQLSPVWKTKIESCLLLSHSNLLQLLDFLNIWPAYNYNTISFYILFLSTWVSEEFWVSNVNIYKTYGCLCNCESSDLPGTLKCTLDDFRNMCINGYSTRPVIFDFCSGSLVHVCGVPSGR